MSGPGESAAAVARRLLAETAGRFPAGEVLAEVGHAWSDLQSSVAAAVLPEMAERLARHRLAERAVNAWRTSEGGVPGMITELAVERLAFCCRHCGQEWQADYDVARYQEPDGDEFDYFAHGGQPVPSPYPAGSVLCPACGQPATAGRLIARREVPVPPGRPGRPRTRLPAPPGVRAERRNAPPLAAVQLQPTEGQAADQSAATGPTIRTAAG